ncbi:DUF4013 domain-containing protein [Marinicella meishanensis]|uniref:DUF4013 domain-containing protein n=1 Tax=Marinicella meishanensis TaxID=2873263 RepID=UPI001CBF7034|nr:DUF4013 domain-containing protein [Marinicella sp. NBU2979]
MVQHCHYHPLAVGTYHCAACQTHACDRCVDDSRRNPVVRCFGCGRELESIGPGHIEPFWRRLPQSFRYPLAQQSMIFILVLSVLCSFALYLPLAWLFYLALFGSAFKYSLSCLSHTADGHMSPPDITEAYEGGLSKMLVLIIMLFVTGLVTNLANTFLGPAMGGVVALLVTLSFPAIIINYAISDDMIDALNPTNILALIKSVGLPYGLILGFIMIMLGSMAVLYQWVFWIPSSIGTVLLYAVTFYYLIVLHHLLGYMVFQYQQALGYSARLQGDNNKRRGDGAIARAKLSALIKTAQFKKATELSAEQVKLNNADLDLNHRHFELLLATGNAPELALFLPPYCQLLKRSGREDLISRQFKRLWLKMPDFQVSEPGLKWVIAQACAAHNNPALTIKLLHGIHKKHPDFEHLIAALQLLAQALDEFPKYANHSQACRKLITRLQNNQATPLPKP